MKNKILDSKWCYDADKGYLMAGETLIINLRLWLYLTAILTFTDEQSIKLQDEIGNYIANSHNELLEKNDEV